MKFYVNEVHIPEEDRIPIHIDIPEGKDIRDIDVRYVGLFRGREWEGREISAAGMEENTIRIPHSWPMESRLSIGMRLRCMALLMAVFMIMSINIMMKSALAVSIGKK